MPRSPGSGCISASLTPFRAPRHGPHSSWGFLTINLYQPGHSAARWPPDRALPALHHPPPPRIHGFIPRSQTQAPPTRVGFCSRQLVPSPGRARRGRGCRMFWASSCFQIQISFHQHMFLQRPRPAKDSADREGGRAVPKGKAQPARLRGRAASEPRGPEHLRPPPAPGKGGQRAGTRDAQEKGR